MNWELILGPLGFACIGAALLMHVIGYWLVKIKQVEQGGGDHPPVPDAVEQRLARIEQIVEATSIEVERIAEAQRYQAKLLSAKSDTTLVS